MTTLTTPALDAVTYEHGLYARRSDLFLAALVDGFTPAGADAYAEEYEALAAEEFAAQQASEIAAENAWLVYAERGDAESQADLDLHNALHPGGYGY